jgi:hypothetical protein
MGSILDNVDRTLEKSDIELLSIELYQLKGSMIIALDNLRKELHQLISRVNAIDDRTRFMDSHVSGHHNEINLIQAKLYELDGKITNIENFID